MMALYDIISAGKLAFYPLTVPVWIQNMSPLVPVVHHYITRSSTVAKRPRDAS